MATPAFAEGGAAPWEKIRSRIARSGPISFRDYMQMALYDPDAGYYASASSRVGKEGDFITSVSVGRCFGLVLAHRLSAFWEEMGRPENFHLIEPGAHAGHLCADILDEIQSHSPRFFDAVEYHLVESSPGLSQAQQVNLARRFGGKFSCHHSLAEVEGVQGAILANELLDAFAVELVRFEDGEWWQLCVADHAGKPGFTRQKPDSGELQAFCDSLGKAFPEGYVTEFNPGIRDFVREASAVLTSGLMIIIDYGMEAGEYYHPDRITGTLQTYHRHLKSDDPLAHPGEIDITSHVDFSRLSNEALAAGFSVAGPVSQANYLTTHAREWLLGMETRPADDPDGQALLRQFQTLTHPAMLGSKFMVLEMQKQEV